MADRDGFFYMVSPDPDRRPERVKFGYTESPRERFNTHMTMAPELGVIAVWPISADDEFATIRAVTESGCRQVRPEMYDFDDPFVALKRVTKRLGPPVDDWEALERSTFAIQVRGFPAQLWRRFRARAVADGLSVREALMLALSRYLEDG